MSVPVSLRALVALLGVGCLGDGPEPAIELGTGEITFAPLANGDEIEVIRGPQGGYHFLGSMRVRGVQAGTRERLDDPTNPTTRFTVLDGDTSLAPHASYRQGLEASEHEDWTHEMIGRLVILDITDDDEINERDVVFGVTVEDTEGRVVSQQLELHVVPNPLNDL